MFTDVSSSKDYFSVFVYRLLKKYKKWNFQEICDAPDAKDIFVSMLV